MDAKNTLPLGDFEDAAGGKWTARLEVVDGKEPIVHLIGTSGSGSAFRLSSFLDALPREDEFRFPAGGFVDDPVIVLPPLETGHIAKRALQRLSALDGRFEIRWVPNDPTLPF